MKPIVLIIALAAGALTTAAPVRAQSTVPEAVKAPRLNLVSANPIAAIFEFYSGEIEHALAPTASIAVAGSHFGFDGANYNNVDAIIRYYPSAEAIRGFAFGGSVGYARVSDDCHNCTSVASAFTIGVRGDYVWVLGPDQRFSVVTGLGAKRLFYSDNAVSGSTALPIARLSVGYAW